MQIAVERMEHWPGARAARVCVDLSDPGAENAHHADSVRLYGAVLDATLAREAEEIRALHGRARPS